MKKYDLFVPLGCFCLPSHSLRMSKLQFVSYPFDWVGCDDVTKFIDYMDNHFQGFFQKENLELVGDVIGNHISYKDTKNGLLFPHCMDKDLPFDEAYDKARATFDRRIERLYQNIAQAKKILFFNVCYKTYKRHDLTDLLDRLRKMFPDKDISLLRVNLSPDFGDKVEYKEVSPDILVYNVNYDMDKNIYTDRDTEMAQIMADFRMRPSKKAVEYKLNEVGFAIKRFLVNCLCCLVPIKRIRHKIRKKFNISTKFFDKN